MELGRGYGEVSARNRAEFPFDQKGFGDWLIIRDPRRLHLSHLLAKVATSIETM